MPLIKLRVMINGSREVEAIYDTGSNVSLINHKMVELLKLELLNDPKVFRTIGGRKRRAANTSEEEHERKDGNGGIRKKKKEKRNRDLEKVQRWRT